MKTEVEQLREEVSALRREIADLRANQTVHHYHHQAPLPQYWPGYPSYPSYSPSVCGGQAVWIGIATQNRLT